MHLQPSKLFSSLIVVLAVFGTTTAIASEIKVSGNVGVDLRWYPQSPAYDKQFSGVEPSVQINPEFSYAVEGGGPKLKFIPFARLSGRDSERTHMDIREAYVSQRLGDWDYLVGLNRVFWGVTESRHLVDIINQTDAIEGIDGEDKLGQAMLNIGVQKDWGRLDAFAMPGFREGTYPGSRGRLRTNKIVDDNQAVFDTGNKNTQVDLAGRYSHYIGDWDVGLSMFHGLSREARLPIGTNNRRAPHYDMITQAGTDIQYTLDEWLWKFEGIVRDGHGDPFAAVTGGFEYTFYQIAESDADIGILSELHWDDRSEETAPSTIFNEDLFLGMRLALNDIDDTTALIGGIIDLQDQSISLSMEADRRIGDVWKISAEVRALTNIDSTNALASFERDSFLNITLFRYF